MTALTAFDADVLIYAAIPEHPLGVPVVSLLQEDQGVGSVLLLPEVLIKPMRTDAGSAEVDDLIRIISRVRLLPFDQVVAELAVALGVRYGLRAADAAHLATAVSAGADRFLTNNRKDFPLDISEIDIIYPEMLG
ncbi:type II toxin-antitoxin system VapC family toxin [Microbacterium sp.]|uniref:type II toxin-antitoxin system VapC family toxin n=1 Tax=Microbacterium sp. TaxID=51671 RepID=UPI0039E2EDAA